MGYRLTKHIYIQSSSTHRRTQKRCPSIRNWEREEGETDDEYTPSGTERGFETAGNGAYLTENCVPKINHTVTANIEEITLYYIQ